MNRKLLCCFAALLALALALLFGDWRSDHDCIRLVVQEELPQARVLKSVRHGRCFAIFFELTPEESDALCRRLPTRNGWYPLTAGMCFGLNNDPQDDLTGLSGHFAQVAAKGCARPTFLIRLNDGKTFVAVMSTISA